MAGPDSVRPPGIAVHLGILAADEGFERIAEWTCRREAVVDDSENAHAEKDEGPLRDAFGGNESDPR